MPDSILFGKNILLGVCGSIAAYKSAEIISALKKKGAEVTVAMTESAKKFITPLTLELISENAVYDGIFEQKEDKIPHINLAKNSDLILVAPATADFIARSANGYASELISAVILSASCPVMIAPAMNSQMLESKAYLANVDKLKAQGRLFIEPEEGWLACGELGRGRLASVDSIVNEVEKVLKKANSLADRKFLVTYGPTIERIDDMRFISNFSSGKTGYCLVEELSVRGADVIAIAGPNSYAKPRAAKYIEVESAAEMYLAIEKYLPMVDCLIMAAAVADFSVERAKGKIKRSNRDIVLKLKPGMDILQAVAKQKKDKVIIGFCAESNDLLKSAKKKLESKNLDLIVANKLGVAGAGPGESDNEVHILSRDGDSAYFKKSPKPVIAEQIIDYVTTKFFSK